jgi:hypothetical protein
VRLNTLEGAGTPSVHPRLRQIPILGFVVGAKKGSRFQDALSAGAVIFFDWPESLSAPKKELGDFEFLYRLLESGLDRLGYVLDGFGRDGLEFFGLLDCHFNLLADEGGLQLNEFGRRLNCN